MKTLNWLAILISLCFSLVANAKPKVSGEVVFGNKYLTFGSGSLLSEEKTVQTFVNAEWDNGVSASVWLSRPINRHVSKDDLANEDDGTLAWNGKLGYWSVGASLTYFNEPKLGSFGSGDIWFTSLKASRSMGHVSLDVNYNTYTPVKGSGFEGGHLIAVGISKKMELAERITLSWFTKVAYDDGGFGFAKGFLGNYGGEVSWKVNNHFSVIAPRFEGFIPFMHDARKNDVMAWAGVSWSL
jgi:hypothetical protein